MLKNNIILTGGGTFDQADRDSAIKSIKNAFKDTVFTIYLSPSPIHDIVLGGNKLVSTNSYKKLFNPKNTNQLDEVYLNMMHCHMLFKEF